MIIDIITIFPEMFEGVIKSSIIKRTIEKDLLNTNEKRRDICLEILKYSW